MRWLATWTVLVLVGLPALGVQGDEADKPRDPAKSKIAEEVDAVIKSHEKAVSDFYKNNEEKLNNATTDKESSKIYESYPKPDETTDQLRALVERNPKDIDAVLIALHWILPHHPYGEKGQKIRAWAIDLLLSHHSDNPKIATILRRISDLQSAQAEKLLRTVMEKNPVKDVRGMACFYLGSHLKDVAATVRQMKEDPEEAKRLEHFHGAETITKLKDADADNIEREAETAFEEAAAKYGDGVMYTDATTKRNITIADRVAGELFEIRNLAIGKAVPDIVGDDLDGKSFKLSDYRGKVVVLDFWGNW
jgi:hypothetical protein